MFVTFCTGILGGHSTAFADPASPIAITIVDSPDPIASGQELTYTITVTNTGGAKIDNVVLSDQVNGVGGIGTPPQYVLSSTRGSCSQNNNLVTCSAGSIEGNGSWTVTIRGIVTVANGTTINNTVSVTGTKSAQNFTSTATTTTLVSNASQSPLPDLTIAKAGPTSVTSGAAMAYTLTVNNIGNANATDIKVVDTVPTGVSIVNAMGTSLFTCSIFGQTVTCTGGRVNQGSNATITINGTAPITATPITITNTASVDPDNTIIESNELNNTTALVNTQVVANGGAAALNITKVGTPAEVRPGDPLTYTIVVTNDSAYRATDVVVTDGTQGLEASSIMASQVIDNGTIGTFGGCTVTAPTVRCAIQRLEPTGTMTVTIVGQVIAAAGTTIFNTATVTGNIRNVGVTNTATALTTVDAGIDLTLTKSDAPDPVCARAWPGDDVSISQCRGGLTYTLIIGNSGIDQATNVVLHDKVPPGAVFDSFVAPAFAGGCALDLADNTVKCTGGTIAPKSTTSIILRFVAPSATGMITNTATVDPNNAIFEADETNNTVFESTQVTTGIDLVIDKTDAFPGFDPIATRGTQTYTITVNNPAPQDVTGISIQDVLAADTIFLSATGDRGFICSHDGGIVTCSGGHLPGTASEAYPPFGGDEEDVFATITIRIFAPPVIGTMHNVVRVDPFSAIAEVDELNNDDSETTQVISGGDEIGAFNQLTIEKDQLSPENPVARNALVTYALTVGNDATDPAVNVRVRDFLPAGSQYVDASGTHGFLCSHADGLVNCTGGGIPAGENATITITAFAPDMPGTYTNQAIVDPDNEIAEGNEFDNLAFFDTEVINDGNDPFIDLKIMKAGTEEVTPGGQIVYTIEVWNVGSNQAANVAMRDVLPAGTTFVSAQETTVPPMAGAFTCNHAGGIVDCIGATLLPGLANTRTITIVATAPNASATLVNQAIVDPDNLIPEGDELNNTSTYTTTVKSKINLVITKRGPTVAAQNTVATYVITVANMKPEPPPGEPEELGETAFDVVMVDPLPVGLIPLAAEIDPGSENNWACTIFQNPINFVQCIGDLNPNQEVEISIEAFVTAEDRRSLDNEACIDPDDLIVEFDPGEGDNCSTHTTAVVPPAPDILVSKSADTTVVTPGQNLTYTITVQNVGTGDTSTPVSVVDELPDTVTFVNATATNGWDCTENTGTVTCDSGGQNLAPGDLTVITILVTVDNDANLPIVNTATAPTVLGEPDDKLANNSSTVVTSVGGSGFDLAVASITDTPDPVNRSQQVRYTVVAVNGGTQAADDVVVRIALPPTGVAVAGADGSNGFNCGEPESDTIDCVGDLPGGGDTVITIDLVALLGAPDDLILTATIDPEDVFDEADESNNMEVEVTTVSGDTCTASPCIDLVAAQLVGSPDPVTEGNELTFACVFVNVGDSVAAVPEPEDDDPELPLLACDVFGDFAFVSRTSSDPAIECETNNDLSVPGASLFSDCKGELGPGQGVTITIVVTPNDGPDVTAQGFADPIGVVEEFLENNNVVDRTVTVVEP